LPSSGREESLISLFLNRSGYKRKEFIHEK
jgi:hypothetical protein